MELQEDGGVKLDYNETLRICREKARSYKSASRAKQWYVNYNKQYPNADTEETIEKFNKKLTELQSWHNLYELLLKNRRFKNEK